MSIEKFGSVFVAWTCSSLFTNKKALRIWVSWSKKQRYFLWNCNIERICSISCNWIRSNLLCTLGCIYVFSCIASRLEQRSWGCQKNRYCPNASTIETVQDFLIKLDIKPFMHLLEIGIFLLNNVIFQLTKIMNRANKNWAHF